jgi:hypothetical protein
LKSNTNSIDQTQILLSIRKIVRNAEKTENQGMDRKTGGRLYGIFLSIKRLPGIR